MVTERYEVRIDNDGSSLLQVTSREYGFTIDAAGNGIRPLDAFLAGLGACVGYYIRFYGTKNQQGLKGFSITVEGELTPKRPFLFPSLAVTVDLKGAQLPPDRREAFREFIRNCPAHDTLKARPEITFQIKDQ